MDWLSTTAIAAVMATVAGVIKRWRYRLDVLSLMLWGATVMILVDKLFGYFTEGTFIEATTEGLVKNGAMLGLLMLLPVVLVWLSLLFFSRRRKDA